MNFSDSSVEFCSQIRVWSVQANSERGTALLAWSCAAANESRKECAHKGCRSRSDSLSSSSSKGRLVSRKFIIFTVAAAAVFVAFSASPAAAAPTAAGPQLSGVIDGLRVWLVGLLAGLATLFLTIGGVRYMLAGGDPSQVERAKSALRSAAIGYALAALSPVLVTILQSVVGS